jgi:hypothetical protein
MKKLLSQSELTGGSVEGAGTMERGLSIPKRPAQRLPYKLLGISVRMKFE